jgi:hypothetical protein
MPIHFKTLLVAGFVFTSASCGPFFVKPGSQTKAEPPPVQDITAGSRKEALAKITESLRKKPDHRVFKAPGNHGWIEQYEMLKVEDAGAETVQVGKRNTPVNQLTCRITWKVSRWKTYGEKTKGEPDVRQVVTTRRYNF